MYGATEANVLKLRFNQKDYAEDFSSAFLLSESYFSIFFIILAVTATVPTAAITLLISVIA